MITLLIVALLFLSASFSGLNIGLMMARPDDLRRQMQRGDKIAKKVYQYRKNGNYFIVTILLGNVSVNAALSIMLGGTVGNGVLAGVIATALITTFGEILPQSLFTQRGWRLTRYFFWLLDIVFILFWPIVKPITLLLDHFIGKELPQVYTHEDFKEMIEDHAKLDGSLIDLEESRIVAGALEFSHQIVSDEMTPLDQVYTVNIDDELNHQLLSRIRRSGHSRFPVKDGDSFVGIFYTKDLLGQPLDLPISRYYRDKIHDIDNDTPLDTALKRFIQTKSHMFMVYDKQSQPVGIITLEDVIESILRREIDDEFDQ